MAQTVKWLPEPEKHDYRAAEDYLSLLMPPKRAASLSRRPAAARDDITHRKAKDILRASQLPLLGEDNKHVASDLRKAASGVALSPIAPGPGRHETGLRARLNALKPGFHRVTAPLPARPSPGSAVPAARRPGPR